MLPQITCVFWSFLIAVFSQFDWQDPSSSSVPERPVFFHIQTVFIFNIASSPKTSRTKLTRNKLCLQISIAYWSDWFESYEHFNFLVWFFLHSILNSKNQKTCRHRSCFDDSLNRDTDSSGRSKSVNSMELAARLEQHPPDLIFHNFALYLNSCLSRPDTWAINTPKESEWDSGSREAKRFYLSGDFQVPNHPTTSSVFSGQGKHR